MTTSAPGGDVTAGGAPRPRLSPVRVLAASGEGGRACATTRRAVGRGGERAGGGTAQLPALARAKRDRAAAADLAGGARPVLTRIAVTGRVRRPGLRRGSGVPLLARRQGFRFPLGRRR